MKITISDNLPETEFSATVSGHCPPVHDAINAFLALLRACGYSEDTIKGGMADLTSDNSTEGDG